MPSCTIDVIMYCRCCGRIIADDSVFCQHCGVKLTADADGELLNANHNVKCKLPTDCKVASGMQQQLELQLHAEYASNNNAHLASVIALFATLMAVVGTYFYVYAKTIDFDVHANAKLLQTGNFFSYDHLMVATIASVSVLFLMGYVCVAMGFKQRKEQFIIYHIRKKYFTRESLAETFPSDYHPFGKAKGEFLQGLFGASLTPIFCVTVAVTLLTVLKGSFYSMWITVAVSGFLMCVLGYYLDRKYIDYKALEEAYLSDKPECCAVGSKAGLRGVYAWAKPKCKQACTRMRLTMRSTYAWSLCKLKATGTWLKPRIKAALTWVIPKLKTAYDWVKLRLKAFRAWVIPKLKPVYAWIMPKLKSVYAWIKPKLKSVCAWGIPKLKYAFAWVSDKMKARRGSEPREDSSEEEYVASPKEEPKKVPYGESDTDTFEEMPHDGEKA